MTKKKGKAKRQTLDPENMSSMESDAIARVIGALVSKVDSDGVDYASMKKKATEQYNVEAARNNNTGGGGERMRLVSTRDMLILLKKAWGKEPERPAKRARIDVTQIRLVDGELVPKPTKANIKNIIPVLRVLRENAMARTQLTPDQQIALTIALPQLKVQTPTQAIPNIIAEMKRLKIDFVDF